MSHDLLSDKKEEAGKGSVILSGDTIRLEHYDSNAALQSTVRVSGNRGMFPSYPDFLERQINELKKKKEFWENNYKTLNLDGMASQVDQE